MKQEVAVGPGLVGVRQSLEDYPEFEINTRFFAAAFDCIHPGMIERDTPPDYLIAILRTAVEVALNRQHHGLRNDMPAWTDKTITAEFVQDLWNNTKSARANSETFDIYYFYGDQKVPFALTCTPDSETGMWKLGYGVVIPQTVQRVGSYSYDVTGGDFNADPMGIS